MQSSLDAFLEHLRSERQVSSHTLDGYRRDLHKILALCEKQAVASWDALDSIDLQGKIVALFGLGDQAGYGEWFLDAMGLLHDVRFLRDPQAVARTEASWARLVKSYLPLPA